MNRYNENEIGNAKKLSREIGVDKLKINKFRCDMENELLFNGDEQFKNVSSWLPTNESLSYYDYAEKRKQKTVEGVQNLKPDLKHQYIKSIVRTG